MTDRVVERAAQAAYAAAQGHRASPVGQLIGVEPGDAVMAQFFEADRAERGERALRMKST